MSVRSSSALPVSTEAAISVNSYADVADPMKSSKSFDHQLLWIVLCILGLTLGLAIATGCYIWERKHLPEKVHDWQMTPNDFEVTRLYYVLVSWGLRPSTRWFPDDNSTTLKPRIMKLNRYIDHDWQMTPIDFEVTRFMKLHRYIDHDWQMTPIDFQVTRCHFVGRSVCRSVGRSVCPENFIQSSPNFNGQNLNLDDV
ncbi:hypothetical protein DPMN_105551 [Dreissena polymorpha]|uniref:Uncharacterized protein n=1 Tax=Dreissena polymorpha TaxID=45954 RepID=A0A9D4K3D7_DREPO|nr:hypothetical protein DPMN_105551 [Dreissena polymorpha]